MLGSRGDGGWLFWRVVAWGRRSGGSKRQVIFFILCVFLCRSAAETLRYSLAEEMERDSFVANITNDLGIAPSQLAARKARVVSEGNEQLFRLNRNTGVLTVKESLDREEICPQSDTCTLFFKIFFENPLQLIRGEVEIRDVNDNSPVFPEKEMVLEILETTPPGSRFPLESAQDKDVGSNGLQNYSLGSNPHFSLALGTGKDGVKHAELVLERQLDREEQRELNLLLTATDGGSPPRSGTAQIRIVVLDANDNIPLFSREVYEVHLAENSPPGQLAVRVTAADPDEGSYGKVRYAFTQTLERARQLFELNPATGEIRVAGNLDFEEAENHKMVVRATDGGGLSAHCKVQVEVLDVNDNAPEIALTSLSASIPEDAPPRTVVALFSVRDRDSGDNGRTECAIDGDLPFSLTPTFDNYYELRTNAALDRERTAEYNITITATDWGMMRLSSQESIFVQISDVNDNPPEFTQEVYTMLVTENNSPMLRIGSVNATDADAGKNARISYALLRQEGKEQPDVSVNSENGDVYILRPLDYEEVRFFEVAVGAADGGSPPLSAQAVLRVVVRDENDNTPVVLHPLPDADVGPNAKVTYSLAPAHPAEQAPCSCISVNSENGHVFVLRPLDYERVRQIEVSVSASDAGTPPLSANVTVRLLVVDENDNAPLVLYPAQDSSPASSELVPMSAEAGYLITKVVAVDADSGQNSWLSYHLLRATDPGLFAVGAQSGEVWLRRPVTDRDAMKQKLVILVRDNGRPPLSATAALSALLLKDFSDVRLPHSSLATEDEGGSLTTYLIISLVFVSLLFLVSISAFVTRKVCKRKELKGEHVLYGTGHLQSGLADAAAAGTLPHPYCYEISLTTGSGNSEFKFLKPMVPSLPPQLSAMGGGTDDDLHFPHGPVAVEDTAPENPGTLTAEQFHSLSFNYANVTVRLVVMDENDNAPLVLYPAQDSSPASSELVPMSAEAGYLITKVVAVDADSGQNSWLSYHLLRATDPGLFAVGAQSGEVRLRRPVTDRDTMKQKLVILVRDNGRPPLSATAALSALLLKDFSDVRLPHSSLATEDEGGSLTTYLIISLVFVSLLFLVSISAFVTRKVCKRKELKGEHVLYGTGHLQSGLADAAAAGTLPHPYCYEISLTTGSGNSEFKFLKPMVPSLPPQLSAMGGGTDDDVHFPHGPVAVADTAPENPGTLSAEQFHSLSFN
ncbi:protocadherin beta-6-like [Athene cunicularia]|uniref:protocadherin beta-6-like n=1 Tax=Athene cunicularia TaxID=194338 RepID=UPI000EF705A8|nr:protocadherin beta-6-like [Athene cunicularia]